MINSPRQLFPSWYKKVDPSCDSETLEKRSKALNTLAPKMGKELWKIILKIYLGVSVSSSEESIFVKYFLDEDEFFPVEKNNHLLRVLAGAVISIRLVEHQSITSYYVSLALIISNFSNPAGLNDLPPASKYAQDAYQKCIESLRKQKPIDFSSLDESSKALQKMTDKNEDIVSITNESNKIIIESSLNLIEIVKQINEEKKSLTEELDSLWWLYGEINGVTALLFEKLGVTKMISFGALDLFNITSENIAISKARDFLHKALLASSKKNKKDEVSLYEVVEALTSGERELFTQHYLDDADCFTPVLSAFKVSLEVDSGEDWNPLYRKKFRGIDIKKKLNTVNLSYQIYNELMLTCHL